MFSTDGFEVRYLGSISETNLQHEQTDIPIICSRTSCFSGLLIAESCPPSELHDAFVTVIFVYPDKRYNCNPKNLQWV